MKKQIWFLLLCFLPILAMAWEVTLEPRRVRAGEWAYLIFRTEKGETLPDPGRDLPEVKGISFARNNSSQSTRIRIVNGRRSHIVEKSIPFLAEKAAVSKLKAAGLVLKLTIFFMIFLTYSPAATMSS